MLVRNNTFGLPPAYGFANSACGVTRWHPSVSSNGFTTAGFAFSRFSADEFELLRVAVAPARRREGIAASLLSRTTRDFGDFLERAGLESGKGWLEVRSDNAGAVSLYAKIGFRERSVRKDYYGDGADALLMALDCFVR